MKVQIKLIASVFVAIFFACTLQAQKTNETPPAVEQLPIVNPEDGYPKYPKPDATEKVGAMTDNLGNHIATQNLNMSGHDIFNVDKINVIGGSSNGLQFYGQNHYSIRMGSAANSFRYGPVQGYSIKNHMYGISNWGWTWGEENKVPVAALNTQGTFQLKKDLFAMGKTGLGTTTPTEKLHVQDGSVKISSSGSDGDPELLFDDGNYNTYKGQWGIEYWSGKEGLNFFKPWPSPQSGNYKLFIHNNGNVGLGTGTPAFKLDVCGTIRANEVRVETGWCDYVFEDDYQLRSLEELETFIHKNKHLPDVPAGVEIENGGLKLAEMQATHMLKIEELTLYIIDMNKEIEALRAQVEILSND